MDEDASEARCTLESCANVRDNLKRLMRDTRQRAEDLNNYAKVQAESETLKLKLASVDAMFQQCEQKAFEATNAKEIAQASLKQIQTDWEYLRKKCGMLQEKADDADKHREQANHWRDKYDTMCSLAEKLEENNIDIKSRFEATVKTLGLVTKKTVSYQNQISELKTSKSDAAQKTKKLDKYLKSAIKVIDSLSQSTNIAQQPKPIKDLIQVFRRDDVRLFFNSDPFKDASGASTSSAPPPQMEDSDDDMEVDRPPQDDSLLLGSRLSDDDDEVDVDVQKLESLLTTSAKPLECPEFTAEVKKSSKPRAPRVVDVKNLKRWPEGIKKPSATDYGGIISTRTVHSRRVATFDFDAVEKAATGARKTDSEGATSSATASGAASGATIHGKKGKTVREQQEEMMKKETVKEKVARMRAEAKKKPQKTSKDVPEETSEDVAPRRRGRPRSRSVSVHSKADDSERSEAPRRSTRLSRTLSEASEAVVPSEEPTTSEPPPTPKRRGRPRRSESRATSRASSRRPSPSPSVSSTSRSERARARSVYRENWDEEDKGGRRRTKSVAVRCGDVAKDKKEEEKEEEEEQEIQLSSVKIAARKVEKAPEDVTKNQNPEDEKTGDVLKRRLLGSTSSKKRAAPAPLTAGQPPRSRQMERIKAPLVTKKNSGGVVTKKKDSEDVISKEKDSEDVTKGPEVKMAKTTTSEDVISEEKDPEGITKDPENVVAMEKASEDVIPTTSSTTFGDISSSSNESIVIDSEFDDVPFFRASAGADATSSISTSAIQKTLTAPESSEDVLEKVDEAIDVSSIYVDAPEEPIEESKDSEGVKNSESQKEAVKAPESTPPTISESSDDGLSIVTSPKENSEDVKKTSVAAKSPKQIQASKFGLDLSDSEEEEEDLKILTSSGPTSSGPTSSKIPEVKPLTSLASKYTEPPKVAPSTSSSRFPQATSSAAPEFTRKLTPSIFESSLNAHDELLGDILARAHQKAAPKKAPVGRSRKQAPPTSTVTKKLENPTKLASSGAQKTQAPPTSTVIQESEQSSDVPTKPEVSKDTQSYAEQSEAKKTLQAPHTSTVTQVEPSGAQKATQAPPTSSSASLSQNKAEQSEAPPTSTVSKLTPRKPSKRHVESEAPPTTSSAPLAEQSEDKKAPQAPPTSTVIQQEDEQSKEDPSESQKTSKTQIPASVKKLNSGDVGEEKKPRVYKRRGAAPPTDLAPPILQKSLKPEEIPMPRVSARLTPPTTNQAPPTLKPANSDNFLDDILSGAHQTVPKAVPLPPKPLKRQATPTTTTSSSEGVSEDVGAAAPKRKYTKKTAGIQVIDPIPLLRRGRSKSRSRAPEEPLTSSDAAPESVVTSSLTTNSKKPGPTRAIMIDVPTRPHGKAIRQEQKPMGLKEAQEKSKERGGKRVDKIKSHFRQALDLKVGPNELKRLLEDKGIVIGDSLPLTPSDAVDVMMEFLRESSPADMWAVLMRQKADANLTPLMNTEEENFLQVSAGLNDDHQMLLHLFIGRILYEISLRDAIDSKQCGRLIRLFCNAIKFAEHIPSEADDVTSSDGVETLLQEKKSTWMKSLFLILLHKNPHQLAKSLAYCLISDASKYCGFLVDELEKSPATTPSEIHVALRILMFKETDQASVINWLLNSKFQTAYVPQLTRDEIQKACHVTHQKFLENSDDVAIQKTSLYMAKCADSTILEVTFGLLQQNMELIKKQFLEPKEKDQELKHRTVFSVPTVAAKMSNQEASALNKGIYWQKIMLLVMIDNPTSTHSGEILKALTMISPQIVAFREIVESSDVESFVDAPGVKALRECVQHFLELTSEFTNFPMKPSTLPTSSS
ncbi:hypothetical protein L5515_002646 [Caenorhabditis briggsae]|uniref:Uncharacterized protein n=1 Tax=Caenorhabditis briggsae TaxID=6238 RepID=A0AAE9E4M6_CAEBR|nr:hypothetical protein L5515_002646 [Caenorhabditis briggsae]